MQHIRNSVLRHIRFSTIGNEFTECKQPLYRLMKRDMCVLSNNKSSDELTARVIELVKNFDKMDASKVTATADFQKDLSLDSLDRVELVMAFEQEFSIEIPDDKADKLTCCADVVKYINEAAPVAAQNS